MYTVYMARNRINGHRYIGMTSRSIAKRRAGSLHAAMKGDEGPLYEAIRHFGIDSFEWAILATVDGKGEAAQIERDLTRVLRPEYNLVFGGGGRAHYIHKASKGHLSVRDEQKPEIFTQTPAIEEWRAVPGFEGYYEVSSHGRVRSLDRLCTGGRWGNMRRRKGRVLAQVRDKRDGRFHVILAKDKKHTTYRVSTLVALAFIGPRPLGLEVCHLFDDKSDNSVGSLYYGTHQQNCDDRTRNGKTMRGEKATGAKLTANNVREIKSALREPGKYTQAELGERYGVTREAISGIARGKNWSHV